MAKKRSEIAMEPEALRRFLDEQRILVVSSLGAEGWPHLVAMWFVPRDGEPWIFTYAKSQKVRNLERDDRATLLIESGDRYEEVKGAMLVTRAHIIRDFETVAQVGEEIFARYQRLLDADDSGLGEGTREIVRERARKRVAVRFEVLRSASWDHAKLGGAY